MDPCLDLRRRLIAALQEQKNRTLREADEGAKLLQEATRQAPAGAAQEAAYFRWQLYRREVLFPAYEQAQKTDRQILELVQGPCDEVRKKARELGIADEGASSEAVEDHLPSGHPTAQDVPPQAAPPPAAEGPEDIGLPLRMAIERVAKEAKVRDAEAGAWGAPPEIAEDLSPVGADRSEAPDETPEEFPALLPDTPEEVEPGDIDQVSRDEAKKDLLAVAIPEEGDWPLDSRSETALESIQQAPKHAEPREPIPAPPRRHLSVWLVALLGSLAGIVAVSAIVIILLNRGTGWETSRLPPASEAATATPVRRISPPPTETDTPIPLTAVAGASGTETPTPVPTPTSTSTPSLTPVPTPTSTSTPSLTPTPTSTSTSTPSPTPMPTPTPTRTSTPSPTPTSTNTPSPTPIPSPTRTSTPSPMPTSTTPQVLVDGTYNVRAGPGTNYDRVGQVQAGQTLDIMARNPDGTWWQVCCVDGERVWIKASLAPTKGSTAAVPVAADIPPTPTSASPTAAPAATPTIVVGVPDVLPGRIAFPVFDPEHRTYDLYVANPDGSGMERVLDEASQPALSPDGQRIAFRRWWDGGKGIEVMNTYGGNQRRFTDFHEDALPFWSPDGKALVFFSRRESDRKSRIYQVSMVDGTESELTRDRGPVYGEYPTWMVDGSIVYRVTWPDPGLGVMNADGSGERVVLLDESATAPAASPDGDYIAFMSMRDDNWEIYRINTDGSGLVRLTDDDASDGLPAWSPDGSTIAFVSDRDGVWAMWAMTASGERHRQLFALPGSPHGLVADEPGYSSTGWLEERISWGP